MTFDSSSLAERIGEGAFAGAGNGPIGAAGQGADKRAAMAVARAQSIGHLDADGQKTFASVEVAFSELGLHLDVALRFLDEVRSRARSQPRARGCPPLRARLPHALPPALAPRE
jgi:hypothetical protein